MTLDELSKKSGVQVATLSRIEHDIMTGTLKSHIELCKALQISLADFYRDIEDAGKQLSVVKQKSRNESFVYSKKATVEMLTTKIMDKKMMPVLINIKSQGRTHIEENKVGTEKFLYLLEGKVLVKVGKEEYKLSKNDSIYFDASLPHTFCNIGKGDARALCVLTPPTF